MNPLIFPTVADETIVRRESDAIDRVGADARNPEIDNR